MDDKATSINAEPSMNCTFRRITIDLSDEYENAADSIRVKCECNSNVIDKSDLQYEEHLDPRIPTLRGIKIDRSDENANDSIRVTCEFDSKMIDESDLQYQKTV
jgi:hypothetical protein